MATDMLAIMHYTVCLSCCRQVYSQAAVKLAKQNETHCGKQRWHLQTDCEGEE